MSLLFLSSRAASLAWFDRSVHPTIRRQSTSKKKFFMAIEVENSSFSRLPYEGVGGTHGRCKMTKEPRNWRIQQGHVNNQNPNLAQLQDNREDADGSKTWSQASFGPACILLTFWSSMFIRANSRQVFSVNRRIFSLTEKQTETPRQFCGRLVHGAHM